ncbi:hypothetical protein MADA3029_510131 [Vibrio nigripulchritudo MADA3029]|nr:hypothetical protein VIBNIAM115_850045 [Vibrio nigripulchritudo AM115]CCN49571.1 hypothetical protein VIBNIMADA3020_750130 [Vibrio nigripulchritudo MADA3020]CCN51408.1 hypothetical protein VIBNIMADA3021_1040131 [Vibrio nigripulchritudo MADA3021]CCN60043.1 hypothetical protein MADA3029_510131 [Vibrio nigripulchritudo MADA3029]
MVTVRNQVYIATAFFGQKLTNDFVKLTTNFISRYRTRDLTLYI